MIQIVIPVWLAHILKIIQLGIIEEVLPKKKVFEVTFSLSSKSAFMPPDDERIINFKFICKTWAANAQF